IVFALSLLHFSFSLLLLTLSPLTSTLFPYTTLFRSSRRDGEATGYIPIYLETTGDTIKGAYVRPELEILGEDETVPEFRGEFEIDRKSTRLNSSHVSISYAVFCLKKKT